MEKEQVNDIQLIHGVEYLILNKIGEGTFGNVWLCCERGGDLFAIKVSKEYDKNYLEDMLADDPDMTQRTTIDDFIDDDLKLCPELHTLLNNKYYPFVVKCYDSGIIPYTDVTADKLKNSYGENIAYVILQYIKGSDMHMNPITSEDGLSSLCSSILSAVHTLGMSGIVPVDLNDTNVMYNVDDDCFTLVDIGGFGMFYDTQINIYISRTIKTFGHMIRGITQYYVQDHNNIDKYIKQLTLHTITPKDALILLSTIIHAPVHLYTIDTVTTYQNGEVISIQAYGSLPNN